MPLDEAEVARTRHECLDAAAAVRTMAIRPVSLLPPSVLPGDYGLSREEHARLQRLLTPTRVGAIGENSYLQTFVGKPMNAHVAYTEVLPLRVYTWQPGPDRFGWNPDPTYNPRPTQVILASSVRVDFLNPLVEQA